MDKFQVKDYLDKAKGKVNSLLKKGSQDSEQNSGKRKILPETAKDLYEDVIGGGNEEKVSESQNDAPEELPSISFQKEGSDLKPPTKPEVNAPGGESQTEEIQIFEDSLSSYQEVGGEEEPPTGKTPSFGLNVESSLQGGKGFFSEFENFLEGNDIPRVADQLVDKSLLDKMKEYHVHKEEGKKYYFDSKDLKSSMKVKLTELRNLEQDWFVHKRSLNKEEAVLAEKEVEIEESIDELKHLMQQMKIHDHFHKPADKKHFFFLDNGQVLKSLSDLRASLRVMDDDLFVKHVNDSRNDFSEWIRGTFRDNVLANALASSNSRAEMIKSLDNAEDN